ncbi:MAG: SnoaL-like domain-containing protein [Clostridiales bacterium]|nr:SnoaL-like domain-containing protein [Clostridiales bacterium]
MKKAIRSYTDEELIQRVWDVEYIKKLMNSRVYYIANGWRSREIDEMWVSEEENRSTASFGRNWGYYVGMASITEYYVTKHINESNIGRLSCHPVSTGLVNLAEDGKTAKGMWYAISQDTSVNPGSIPDKHDGMPTALWTMEKIAVDFIKEADGWKIWHMIIATDLTTGAGEDYGKQPVYPIPGSDPVREEFGRPDIEMLTHDNLFNWWDNYPPMPMPYVTFSDDISYGPEGHPDYKG